MKKSNLLPKRGLLNREKPFMLPRWDT